MKNVGSLAIKLNEAILGSRRPGLIASYSLARELATYTALLPLLLLAPLAKGKKKFLIYAQPRTGSTLLVDLLNSHPNIRCEREVLAFRPLLTRSFLEARRSLHPRYTYGCKILNHQLERQVSHRCTTAFLRKIQNRGWGIIHLRRENVLRQALSRVLVDSRRLRHLETGEPRWQGQVRISAPELHRCIRESERWTRRDQRTFAQLPHLELVYERDLLQAERHQAASNRVFEFLEVARAGL